MSFGWPWALALLALIPAVLVAMWVLTRRRPPSGIAFPDLDILAAAAPPPRKRRFIPLALATLGASALVVGLARPETTRVVPREQATIVLAIDVSGSMEADDVKPTRLRAAQDAAGRFAEKVPRQYQIGLVTFSGVATTVLPPTTDRPALRQAIESLVADGNTAIGDAVVSSLDAIRSTQPQAGDVLSSARVLLLSDGSNRVGVPLDEAAELAKKARVRVFTVALGTPDGVTPDGISVPPDVEALKRLAKDTGGIGYESRDAESVGTVYDNLGTFIGTDRVPAEATAWWALGGSILLALAALAGWRFAPRVRS